ncbi:MAG: hypothetical protein IJP14_00695 [Clostridia bacterium]|nr:hypothetical protein [Clostridia bacterium]
MFKKILALVAPVALTVCVLSMGILPLHANAAAEDYEFFQMRDGLANTYLKLQNEKELTVAFMGGSVTYGIGCSDISESFRLVVKGWLQEQFPDATITEINAAYPSACSAYGVYAVDDFVIAQDADLVFLEYGINDRYASTRYTIEEVKANYESILRKLYRADPTCDVVALYTTDSGRDLNVPLYEHVAAQDEVAQYYGIPSINMGWKLRTDCGLTVGSGEAWNMYFSDGVHANALGNQKYGEIINGCLAQTFEAAKAGSQTEVTAHTIPSQKAAELVMNTQYVKSNTIPLPNDWQVVSGGTYPVVATAVAGSELTYTFKGTGISLFIDGTNMTLEYAVDGGAWQSQNITGYYHLPLPLVSGLESREHTITIKAPATTTASNKFKLKAIFVRKSNDDVATFTLGNVTAHAGKTFTVPITVANNPGMVSFGADVTFDSSRLEFVSLTKKDFTNGELKSVKQNNGQIHVSWTGAGNANNTTDGIIALLTFKAADTAPMGDTPIAITCDQKDVYNQANSTLLFATVDGVVSITAMPGDVNADGTIDNADLEVLLQYLNNWDVEVAEAACDVNDDGKINNKDVGLLLQYLNDWDVELGPKPTPEPEPPTPPGSGYFPGIW